MPEEKITASETLITILEKKYVEIDRLKAELKSTKQDVEIAREAIRELEDPLADCAKQKNAEPDTTNLFLLGAQKKLCEAKEQRIQLLENTLAERTYERDQLAKQHKDTTMPETPTKLEAFWKGFADCNSKNATSLKQKNEFISKLTRERDALKKNPNPYHTEALLAQKDHIIKNQSEANDWQANKIGELEKKITELRKEKDHYEKVAQENCHLVQRLEKEVAEFKSNNRFHRGHSAGYAEALAKAQDAILKLRE